MNFNKFNKLNIFKVINIKKNLSFNKKNETHNGLLSLFYTFLSDIILSSKHKQNAPHNNDFLWIRVFVGIIRCFRRVVFSLVVKQKLGSGGGRVVVLCFV